MARESGGGGTDYTTEDDNTHLLPPPASWRLDIDKFRLPRESHKHGSHDRVSSFSLDRLLPTSNSLAFMPKLWLVKASVADVLASPRIYAHLFLRCLASGKQRKVSEYYKKQERLLEGYNEMEAMTESGCFPGNPTEDEMKQLAKSERLAIHISNVANLLLFAAKVYASMESKSLAVIASTLDSLLDLLSGFILWFTSHAMKKPNHYHHYPIGKKRMQPVKGPRMDKGQEKWMIAIMVSVTVVKFLLMLYCRRFKNEIVRAYAQDHLFDVVTNSVGLITAVLAIRYYWWIDPTGAIIVKYVQMLCAIFVKIAWPFNELIAMPIDSVVYHHHKWARTVIENVWSLIGRTAPPEFLAKLTYLIWNHHKEIKHIDTVRAYTFGNHYFAEVDIVLPEDMVLNQAHNIGEDLQEKLEQLPEVERAFVHIDFEFSHRPEHEQDLKGDSTNGWSSTFHCKFFAKTTNFLLFHCIIDSP
ncbi:hypothetical protein Peur_017653 [Populus x canadensis]